ncbi:MAG TPA: GNAT family N-acetyltransferase [Mycobacterium sp.]|nr:GNAT family N-acetyltransferase [Mycobacterium sp.]
MLRSPRADDAEALFARLASDPRVTEFSTWRPHRDVVETRRVIQQLSNARGDLVWILAMQDTGEVIGEFGYRRPQAHAVELGYCLAREWWGQGLISETLGVVLEWFARDRSVYRVRATCHIDNSRSARLLEAAGLCLEGRLRRYAVFANSSPQPQDGLLFAKAMREG